MRVCPRCTFLLDVVTHGELTLDHCRRCGGTFLDPGEESVAIGFPAAPQVWEQSSVTHKMKSSKLRCPEDQAPLITYAVAFEDERVEVDLCPECSGLWLDAQEGMKLRDIVMAAGQSTETDLVSPEEQPGIPSYLFQMFSGFPMEVWNPRRTYPTFTFGLIGILYAVFTYQVSVVFFGGEDAGPQVIQVFGLVPNKVLGGQQLWTLITCAFFHAGIVHILGNTYFLDVFGDNVEDLLGKRRFLFLYFVSAIVGSILQVGFQTDPAMPSIGASGAVAGLMGAYLVLFPRVKLYLVLFFLRFRLGVTWYLGFWVGFNVFNAFAGGEDVAWMAHVGGFIAGVLIGMRYRIRPLTLQLEK